MTVLIERSERDRRRSRIDRTVHELHTGAFDIVADGLAVRIGADAGQQLNGPTKARQTHSNVQWRTARMPGGGRAALDDVDEGLADDEATHDTSSSAG